MTSDLNNTQPNDQVSELLLRWRQLRDQGQPCSPEQLCPDQPEVQAELRRRIAVVEMMEQLLGPGMRTGLMPDGSAPSQVVPPRTIAGYEILEELGRGGMGVVYKARQKGLERLVALKMILAGDHAGPQQKERFKAEALALARLQHPNIVQVYEAGEADGLPYLSLEFVEGGSLDRHLAGRALPPREAAALVETLARAVAAAHAAGIVHRDLKPGNVLLQMMNDECGMMNTRRTDSSIHHSSFIIHHSPKITDFGLAKMLDAEGRTQTGDVLGTPCYMAPEQAEGRIKDIGPATDVYSLGAILYECLTGTPPFRGQSTVEVLLQVSRAEPSPPSRLNAKLPRDLETICLKCLHKEPARRYASAGELADDLKRFLDGRPIEARPVRVGERVLKWLKRRPERALLLGVLVVLLPLLVFALRPRRSHDPEPQIDLPEQARAILVKYCYHCHGRDPARIDGELVILDRGQLLDPERKIVVPGDVATSRLIERIEDGSMPPEEKEHHPRLGSTDIETLKTWVLAGAEAFHGPEPDDARVAPPEFLATEVHDLFQRRCHECHRPGNVKSGIKILNHDLLIEKKKLVVPGQPDRSPLYRSLITPERKKRMPPVSQPPLKEEETVLVRRWIEAGAPPFALPRK